MKTIGIVCISLLGGFVGRTLVPAAKSTLNEIHFAKDGAECDLTARGLHIKWKDGREVNLEGNGLEMRAGPHSITLASDQVVDASYLILDGRVWHAPSTRNKITLLADLASVGVIDLNKIEDHQPN